MKTIPRNIMKLHDEETSACYRIPCSCGDSDHDTSMWIEVDNDTEWPSVEVCFYKNFVSKVHWGHTNIFVRAWKRLRYSFELLFFGYIEMGSEVFIDDEDHIQRFIDVLEISKDKLSKAREV